MRKAQACGAASDGPDARHDALPWRDRQRLGELLDRLQPRLTAVALRYTRDPETAQDVVQNAFAKVVRHGDQFRGNARASTWMHRIVVNEALMFLRSERRRRERWVAVEDWDELGLTDPSPDAAEQLEREHVARRVRRGLAALSVEERTVLERCTLGDDTYQEFGAETGTHPAAIKSRAFRARRRLGQLLGGV